MCKIEFFNSSFIFQSAHLFNVEKISVDYLTLDATDITITGTCKAQKGSYAHITGDIDFDGMVSDVQPSKGIVVIAIRPLQALFDFETFTSTITDVADWLYVKIKDTIVNNSDELQNRPVIINNGAPSEPRPIATEGNKVNVTEIMAAAITTHQIAVDCKLDMAQKKIIATILKVIDSEALEADLENVIFKEITLGDSYGSFNKAIIRKTSTDGETGIVSVLDTVLFYLHTDGTVSAIDGDRISPVFFILEDIETNENWSSEAAAKAVELLSPQQFDNEIILTYQKQDRLCSPQTIRIGTSSNIHTGGKAYTSILTGKVFSENTIQLVFGTVRVDLTKKLIIERRKQK